MTVESADEHNDWVAGVFDRAAATYDRIGTDICSEFRDRAEKLWQDNGATVLRLPPEDRQELAKRVVPLGDRILSENPRTKEVYDLLKASAARHKRG